MKKRFLLCLLLGLYFGTYAKTDTLRMYNPAQPLANSAGNFELRVARFDIPTSGTIKSISLILDGQPDTLTLRLFGHEGGTSFPQLFDDLIPPMSIIKTTTGRERVSIELDSIITLTNNQFFVAVSDIDNGTYLQQSRASVPVKCTSSSGGNYYHQFLYNGTAWSYSTRAFAIDVVMQHHDVPSQFHFMNITDTADIIGSGDRIAAADINNDGLIDILQGGKLLINRWWTNHKFEDVTESSGLSGNPKANAFVDMNNDGHLDILFLEVVDSSFIYLNDGQMNFTKKRLKGIPLNALDRINTLSISDINGDQYPDIFVGQLWETYPQALPKYLFMNTGLNDFIDESHLLYPNSNNEKNAPCRGSQFVDFNNDGCTDLYVANYVTTASKQTSPRDELWMNNGDGTFTNVIGLTGIDTTIGASFWNMSSGCHWSDYDNDGDMDLLAPTLSHPRFMNGNDGEYTKPTTIYRNDLNSQNDVSFSNMEELHHIEYEETHAGATWGDYNNDGRLDFFVSSFYGCRYNDVYVQNSDHSFSLASKELGLNEVNGNQDGIWLDFNNDGKLDLMAGGDLYQNTGPYYGHWIELQAKSETQNTFAIGAKIIVYAQGKQFTREVTVGRGQKMQRPYRLHFGLGYVKAIDSVAVIWPGCDHKSTVYLNLELNNVYVLEENGNTTLFTQLVDEPTIKIYPVPFNSTIHLQSSLPIEEVLLIDMNGVQIPISVVTNTRATSIKSHTHLASGVYLIRAKIQGRWITKRVVKIP